MSRLVKHLDALVALALAALALMICMSGPDADPPAERVVIDAQRPADTGIAEADLTAVRPPVETQRSEAGAPVDPEPEVAPAEDTEVEPPHPDFESFEILHAGSTRAEIKAALKGLMDVVPSEAVHAAHTRAIAEGRLEVVGMAEFDEGGASTSSIPSSALKGSTLFIDRITTSTSGEIIKSTIAPEDIPGFATELRYAQWLSDRFREMPRAPR